MPSGRPAPATMVRFSSVFAELEDAAPVDAERGGGRRQRFGHEPAQVVGLERKAAELCDGLLLARLARDLLLGLRPFGDIAGDDEHGFDGVVVIAHRDRLDENVSPSLRKSKPLRSPCSAAR